MSKYKCPGYCCEAFGVGTPEQFSRTIDLHYTYGNIDDVEEEFLRENIIPLPPQSSNKNPTGKWLNDREQPETVIEPPEVVYHTCKMFDRTTRSCMAYDRRPHMCRVFPNYEPCNFEGCEHGPVLTRKETP